MNVKRLTTMMIGVPLLIASLSGCGEKQGKAIELTKTSCEMIEGETTIVYALTEEAGKVNWSSSDESVASVENGEILGKKAGNATITATFGNETVECSVVIHANATEGTILCSKEEGYYLEAKDKKGLQTQFVLQTTDAQGNVTEEDPADLQYEMYNKQIATVDEKGVIHPLSVGPTTLTVTSGEFTCSVEVVISTKLIQSTKDWLDVIKETDNLDGYYYVTENLNFNGVAYNAVGKAAATDAKDCFRGTIDGGNHKVKNITSSGSIFGPLLDAKISNLSFENVSLGGAGLAPSISGNGATFSNLFVDLKKASKAIVTGNLIGCGSMEKCLFQVQTGGLLIAGNTNDEFAVKDTAVVCAGSKPKQIPEGMEVFTTKMDAVWAINSKKMLGSSWEYTVDSLPTLRNP